VQHEQVDFVDARRALVRHTDLDIGFAQGAPDGAAGIAAAGAAARGIAQQGHHGHVAHVRGLDRGQHGRRLAAGADGQQHVAALPQRAHLAREAVGVADLGRVGGGIEGVERQRDGAESGTIAFEAADKVRGELRRQQARDARAARQDLAAEAHEVEKSLHGLRDRFAEKRPGLVLEVRAVDEVLLDPLLEHGPG
jgi:hypothetical protein